MIRPCAAVHHGGSEGADGVRRSGEVDVNGDVPVGVLHLQQGSKLLDAAIGKENVDAAELALDLMCRGAQSRQVALVEDKALPLSSCGVDQRASLFEIGAGCWSDTGAWIDGRTDVDAGDVGSALRERNCCSAADSACCASDDGYFAIKHVCPAGKVFHWLHSKA